MSEQKTLVNFNNVAGLRLVVKKLGSVSEEEMHALQLVHFESIKANLPREEWGRAEKIVNLKHPEAYRESRIKPNILRGKSWNEHQLSLNPHIAIIYDSNESPVSGLLVEANSSASHLTKKPLDSLEYWPKMVTPPWLHMPLIGGKRYYKFRECYVMPGLQAPMPDVGGEMDQASGIIIVGLYHLLLRPYQNQLLTAYVAQGKPPESSTDPADLDLAKVVRAIGMVSTGTIPNNVEGYLPGSKLRRVQLGVGESISRIIRLPGMLPMSDVSMTTSDPGAINDVKYHFYQ